MTIEIKKKDSKHECHLHPKWDFHLQADFRWNLSKSYSSSNGGCSYFPRAQSLGPINFVYITGRFLFIKGKCSCQWLGNKLFTVWKTTDFLRWLDDFACFGVLLKKQSYIKQLDFKQIYLEHFRAEGLWDYLVKRHDFKDEKTKI